MNADDVEISSPDKILFPGAGITKQEVADYYARIADRMLPHLACRPLTLRHYPQGIEEDGFFQKQAPNHFPDFIPRMDMPVKGDDRDTIKMATAVNKASLVYFADQNVIEFHMSLSTEDRPEKPDQMIFDLDPSDDFGKVREVAFALKDILDKRQWTHYLKLTGSRGVHIHVPLHPDQDFDTVKNLAHEIAQALNEATPKITTLEQRKDKRGDKVFIDYLRNDYAMTAIAPYSIRALKNAPLAAPIGWDELHSKDITPQSYTLENIFYPLSQLKSDPWANF